MFYHGPHAGLQARAAPALSRYEVPVVVSSNWLAGDCVAERRGNNASKDRLKPLPGKLPAGDDCGTGQRSEQWRSHRVGQSNHVATSLGLSRQADDFLNAPHTWSAMPASIAGANRRTPATLVHKTWRCQGLPISDVGQFGKALFLAKTRMATTAAVRTARTSTAIAILHTGATLPAR